MSGGDLLDHLVGLNEEFGCGPSERAMRTLPPIRIWLAARLEYLRAWRPFRTYVYECAVAGNGGQAVKGIASRLIAGWESLYPHGAAS